MSLPTTTTVASETAAKQHGYDALLGDLYIRLAVSPNQRLDVQTADPQQPPVETGATAEEYVETYGKVWARSDFTGGEGLYVAYRRGMSELDLTRYWASHNLDITPPHNGTPPVVRLGVSTQRIDTLTNTIQRMAWTGSKLYVTTNGGNTLRVSSNPFDAAPTFADEDPHAGEAAGPVTAVVNDGTTVYAAVVTNGIHWDDGAGWAHYSNVVCDGLWHVGARLFAAYGPTLYEVPTRGTPPVAAAQTLKVLGTGRAWYDACEAGSHLLAAGSDGVVYAFQPDAAGVLQLVAQTPIEGGEQPTGLIARGSMVFYTTREVTPTGGGVGRFYRATLREDGVLDEFQLLRQWGDPSATIHHETRKLLATRDSVFTFARDSASQVTVWRYDLATAGLSAAHVIAVGGTTTEPAVSGGLIANGLLFAGLDGAGVYRTLRTDMSRYSTGWLMTPLIDFYTASDKTWAAVRVDGELANTAVDGNVVRIYYATDPNALTSATHAGWTLLTTIDGIVVVGAGDTTFNQDLLLSAVKSRYFALMVELRSKRDGTASTMTPSVRSVSVRGFVSPTDLVVTLPVNVSDQIERSNRRSSRVPGHGDEVFAALLDRVGDSITLNLYRPLNKSLQGTVTKVGAPIISEAERGSVSAVCLVEFRGREVT